MKIKLKVLSGSSAGTEIPVKTVPFKIGRGEDCHLRPKSDAISRLHCALFVKDERLIIQDQKSRSGTLVNGEAIAKPREIKMGDTVAVGPLEFEILIDYGLGGEKKPKVQSVDDVAQRTSSGASKIADDDVNQWLLDEEEMEEAERQGGDSSRNFSYSEEDLAAQDAAAEARRLAEEEAEAKKNKKKKKKKEYGKLPVEEEEALPDSGSAADRSLRDFLKKGGMEE